MGPGACSDGSLMGALVEVGVYGYVLLQGAGLLADGSELLLEVVEPGIIGGTRPRRLLSRLQEATNVISLTDQSTINRVTGESFAAL